MTKRNLYIKGMHGLGDNLHQRALIKELYERFNIYLETSWPQIYHDFPNIKFIAKGTKLRTQLKNQSIHRDKFLRHNLLGRNIRYLSISYSPQMIRNLGSVLKAMNHITGTQNEDFSLPVLDEWYDKVRSINTHGKPILIYRPLVERKEWTGGANRNPDFNAYYELFKFLNPEKYFVISIADIEPGQEWITSKPIKADLEFHKGEMNFESLAALFKISNLVYCAPGFSAVLSKAVGTPVITVFGGYENSASFTSGNTPYLGIDTIAPCQCFSHTHPCVKIIDLIKAKEKIGEFLVNITKSKD